MTDHAIAARLRDRLHEAVNDAEATAMNCVYVNVLLRDLLKYVEREAASRLAEGTSGYSETIGEPRRVVMFKGVEFVNESPNEITLEPEGPMRMLIRVSTPPASPAATSAKESDDVPDYVAAYDELYGSAPELVGVPLSELIDKIRGDGSAERPAQTWQPIESAPKDGTAVLGFGLHSGPQPDAQRGVKAGDHWWAIMLWDMWRNPDPKGWGEQSLWVFAKDGKPTWSRPTHWMPLPAPPGPGAQEK